MADSFKTCLRNVLDQVESKSRDIHNLDETSMCVVSICQKVQTIDHFLLKTYLQRNVVDFAARIAHHLGNVCGVSVLEIVLKMESFLLEKNQKYGNSALNPCRVFSRAQPYEQLLVRIDDKISRFFTSDNTEDEDVLSDLLGYLVVLAIYFEQEKQDSIFYFLGFGKK